MFGSWTPVVKNIIIANALVYLAQIGFAMQGKSLTDYGALWPFYSGNFKIWQLITHMFMHGGHLHIFFNMFVLYMFGPLLEYEWGARRFFHFYMICGILAGVTHLLLQPGIGEAVGASGAVMGVLAAFAYLRPDARMMLLFLPIPIKAKYFVPGLMAIDLFGGLTNRADGVAHWAHLGGAVAGFILAIIWKRPDRRKYYH